MLTGETALKRKGPFEPAGGDGPADAPVRVSPAVLAGTHVQEGQVRGRRGDNWPPKNDDVKLSDMGDKTPVIWGYKTPVMWGYKTIVRWDYGPRKMLGVVRGQRG